MKELHIRTPLLESQALSKRAGARVFLKLENTQPAGSFKIRGIGRLCQRAREEGKTRFVSSSGGNAGFAAAWAGSQLGVETRVFVPSTTSSDTINKIRELGAHVAVHGDVWDETDRFARELAQDEDTLYIHPFDHPLIWEGHSSMIDEIVETITPPDLIILSVGGGGLLCGVLHGLHKNNLKDLPVVAVETEGTASFFASHKAGRLITLDKIDSMATSLGAKTVARQALDWSRKHTIHPLLVTDRQAVAACIDFANDHRQLVEAACGASLSVAYMRHACLEGVNSILIIVCGGIGIDLDKIHKMTGESYSVQSALKKEYKNAKS